MKVLLLFSVFTLTSIGLFSQDRVRTVAHYQNIAKSGNIFVRGYSLIIGASSYVWKQDLKLKSDGSFFYSHRGGECGTFDHTGTGTWTRHGNELILQTSDDLYLLSKRYTISKRSLSPADYPDRSGAFRMKRESSRF